MACYKVLEGMLVRHERKYISFIRLVQQTDTEKKSSMQSWNAKVEKVIGVAAGYQLHLMPIIIEQQQQVEC